MSRPLWPIERYRRKQRASGSFGASRRHWRVAGDPRGTEASPVESQETSAAAHDDSVGDDRECPFCKEAIKPDATKCKHCGSMLADAIPQHHGTCPYCKEDIQPSAIKCKHCKSNLASSPESLGPCGCSGQ